MPSATPTAHGRALVVGDALGYEYAPECCGREMRERVTVDELEYVCGSCGMVVSLDERGLVADISKEGAA